MVLNPLPNVNTLFVFCRLFGVVSGVCHVDLASAIFVFDAHETDEPLIFQGADDLRFYPGWLEAAKAKLAPGIGVVVGCSSPGS